MQRAARKGRPHHQEESTNETTDEKSLNPETSLYHAV